MKKIFTILILLLGIYPCFKEGHLTLTSANIARAQDPSESCDVPAQISDTYFDELLGDLELMGYQISDPVNGHLSDGTPGEFTTLTNADGDQITYFSPDITSDEYPPGTEFLCGPPGEDGTSQGPSEGPEITPSEQENQDGTTGDGGSWDYPIWTSGDPSGPSPDVPPDDNDLLYTSVSNGVIRPREPTAADRATIAKIVHDYDSTLFGLIVGDGYWIQGAMVSSGSNFGYGAFWRLAQNIPPNSYTGALGVCGEGVAAHQVEGSFNGFSAMMYTNYTMAFHSSSQNGSWDFMIDVKANQSGALQIGDASSIGGASYSVTHPMNANDHVSIYYEVKTLSPNSDAATISSYITTGFNQAIDNAQQNASTTHVVASVLIVDYDAYMKAYNSNPTQFAALFTQLNNLGGWLHLEKDLFKNSKTAVDTINAAIKSQTSP